VLKTPVQKMNMKYPIVIMAAMTLSAGVQAQSLEEGVKLYNYERYESAKKALAPLAAGNATANYYYGLSELQLGNTDAAAAIFAKHPTDIANRSGNIRVAFKRGNATEAIQQAQALAGSAKKKEWEQLKYAADALTYSDGANRQQAIDWYKEVLVRNPNANVLLEMGDAYLEIPAGGGPAMTSFEKLTEKDPKHSLGFTRIGKLWYDAKSYEKALESYKKAQEADPENPLPYRYLADAYFWVNKMDLSRKNLEEYLNRADKTNEDMYRYAQTLYLTKDYKKAIETSNDLISKGNKKPALVGILAFSYFETKDSAKALEYSRAYRAAQDPAKIGWMDMVYFGKIMLVNGMTDSANYFFEQGIAAIAAQDKSEVYKEIADYFVSRKTGEDYLNASKWYGRIVAEKANATATEYFNWGVYAYYGKDLETAAKAFEQMEIKHPTQPSATYWRGRTAAAKDSEAKDGGAVGHYEKWLTVNVEGYQRKPADLMQAYQYLTLYNMNKGDRAKTIEYVEKVEAIEANNAFAKQIRDYLSKAKKS
jgi:tetratricopeptide (TPR) repeat protein